MSHFFISYSHQDEKLATELQAKLADEGLLTWTDHQIPAGSEWRTLIDLAIEGSLGVLLIVSKDSMASTYVQYEWVYGMGKGKEIIPVSIDDTRPASDGVHPKLEPLQWIISQDKLTTWQGELVGRLKDLAGVVKKFSPLIERAVDLFDSVDSDDRYRGLSALKNNTSEEVIDALLYGCHHDYRDVRDRCAEELLIISNDYDAICIPIIKQLWDEYNPTDLDMRMPRLTTLTKAGTDEHRQKLYEHICARCLSKKVIFQYEHDPLERILMYMSSKKRHDLAIWSSERIRQRRFDSNKNLVELTGLLKEYIT